MTAQRIAIVGAGTVGCHAARLLARRGHEVHAYDRFPPGHPYGAAGGEGRLMGSMHGQSAAYDGLYRRAFDLWGELEREIGYSVRVFSGKLTIGPRERIEAAHAHGIGIGERYELLDDETLAQNHPFQAFAGEWAVLDRLGGMVRSELAVSSAADVATRHGATFRIGGDVLDVRPEGDGATVVTESGSERYDRVIVTTGAWARRLFPDVTAEIRVFRPVLAWFAPRDAAALATAVPFSRFTPQFYGVPTLDGRLLRLGYGGPRQKAIAEAPGPGDYYVSREEWGEFPDIVRAHFPRFNPDPVRVNAYFEGYVEGATPIIRRVGAVTLGVGFSGNAFKFAPAYGEVVADLATTGEVRPEAAFLVG